MKTMKTLMLVVLLGLTTIANAETRGMNKSFLAKAVVIDFENVKKGQLLQVIDSEGFIIYSEELASDGNYEKVFNFDALLNGMYTIELEKDFEILVRPFQIKDYAILFDDSKEYRRFKPFISTENSLLKISKLNLESLPVNLRIYYKDELIYSESFKDQLMINKVFRLSSKMKGNYTAKIIGEDKTFVHHFKI